MPYSPSERFDPTLGGLGAAQAIAEAWKKYQDNERVDSMNDQIMAHAVRTGHVTLDDYNAYKAAPMTKRQGIANGVQANILEDYKQQQQQAQMMQERASAAHSYAVANQINQDAQFTQPDVTTIMANGQPVTMVQTAPRHYQPLKEVAGAQGDTLQLTPEDLAAYQSAGKLPLRTSQHSFQPADKPEPAGSNDPTKWRRMLVPGTTDQYVVIDGNGELVPNNKLQGVLHPSNQVQMYNQMMNDQQKPGAAPAAVAPVAPPAPAATPNPAAAQASQIKAAYAAGQMTREDAIKQLQAIGFQ